MCRCFVNRPVNLVPRSSRNRWKHSRHGEIILVQAGALRLVSEGFEFVFLGSSAQLAYNGGARKHGFRSQRTQENRSIPPEP